MKNKPRKVQHGILRIGVIVPITDPAEQDALDRRCGEAEKMLAAQRPQTGKGRSRRKGK